MEKSFETYIMDYLKGKYNDDAQELYSLSHLLQYIAKKTKSANKSAKARSSFANLYAIYVVVEDYINKGYNTNDNYKEYEGAQFSALMQRQRELPFGGKLQNHALNSRMNDEFFKYFPLQKEESKFPIIRDLQTKRYWINENYIKIKVGSQIYNIAEDIIAIIDKYVNVKKEAFDRFIVQCEELQNIDDKRDEEVINFIMSLLDPNVDARLFEIVSFSILKYYYIDTKIYWGYSTDSLNEEQLHLYKTGRTNANDGGIDFVMKPLGKFFQVTETLDFKKYFLDIDKIERYPISFVIKSEESKKDLLNKLKNDALQTYVVESVVDNYMKCIEDIINIPFLKNSLHELESKNTISNVLKEIISQSKLEFNYDDNEDEEIEY